MPPVPPVETVYLVVYPQGRSGNPGIAESNYTLQTASSESGLHFVPVFTTEDLGEQWIAREKLTGATTHNLSIPGGFSDFLRLLQEKNGPEHVGYDPIVGAFPVASTSMVLAELRKSTVAANFAPVQAVGCIRGTIIPYPAPAPPEEDEFDAEIREVSSVVWAKIKKAMAERKAQEGCRPPDGNG